MDILDFVLERNRECLIRFGITDFNHQLFFFRQVLEKIGAEQISRWRELLLEPVYWPPISLGPTDEYWGWKVRPNGWYFGTALSGSLFRRDEQGNVCKNPTPWILQGGVYLVDTRQKPNLQTEGGHMWLKDENFLGAQMADIRRNYPPSSRKRFSPGSRFCINRHILRDIKLLLAQSPEFRTVKYWRSESASEFNFIAQSFPFMLRRWDGETDTDVLFDDVDFGGGGGNNYLIGGSCDQGGLANIHRCFVERLGHLYLSLRLLGVLELEIQT